MICGWQRYPTPVPVAVRRSRTPTLSHPKARADAVAVDAFVQERSSLLASHSALDDATNVASALMSSLKEQRGIMKNAHKRVLDIASSLGISTSLAKLIERRTVGDRIVVYGGSAVIVLLIIIVHVYG